MGEWGIVGVFWALLLSAARLSAAAANSPNPPNCPPPPPPIRQIVTHDTVRFLPSQEWSAGDGELWAYFGHCCCPPPDCPPPPPPIRRIRPIVARILAKIRPHTSVRHRQQCQNTPPIPIPPGRPFLRRQESHNHVPPTAASLRRQFDELTKRRRMRYLQYLIFCRCCLAIFVL